MGLMDKMNAAGFKAEKNEDQEYPPIVGEFKGVVTDLKVFEKEGSKAYQLNTQIAETLSGKVSDGRFLSKFYNVQGTNWDGTPITEEQAMNNVKRMLNDLFTMGVELDCSSDDALEASFVLAKDASFYCRAWTREANGKTFQNWTIKQQKDLKKESKGEKKSSF